MKIAKSDIKKLILKLGFVSLKEDKETFFKNYKQHNDYVIKVNFKNEKIDYGTKIKLGDLTTSNFENSENFVVLECVNRVLEKGYSPEKLSLEHNMNLGRREKGKLDILIMSKDDDKAYIMIECKTWGDEFKKERNKMLQNGGQLFSYYDKGRASKYLCLYTSRLLNDVIEYVNDIVKVEDHWKELDNDKEVYEHWNKNFKDNGIFEEWANPYDIEIKALTRGRLKELTEEDSGRIFNQFAEILRHNVVSDKPNAFNKIFNLFLCKIVDEDRKTDEELKFQWLETDTDEDLQKRLSDLYKQGMKEYLTKEVTDYNDEQVAEKLYALDPVIRDQIRDMFTRVRLHKNNEFAFKEVFDEKSFRENAIVVREVVELLQPYQIRYGHKQQFLGDFFELLLSTGIKQEAGQFFTPVPVAKFIISSLPIDELIKNKINGGDTNFLPYVIDFAAGSGHFLTEAMDEIQNIIENIDPVKQRPSVKAKLKSWREAPFEWCYDFIYGIEADYRLVKTAKVSCFLNGDGLANVIHADGLDHFQKSIDYKGKLKEVSQDDTKDNAQFDILVANPPYSVSAFKNTLKNGDESFELFNRLTDDSSEIECLFIERIKQLLKPGGWAGVILPSSILSNSGIYTDARELILKYFDLKAIAEFGSNTFMATGTNTVTLFLERKPNNEWKKIETAIINFFEKPKEANVNNIDKAFSKYVTTVFEGLELGDYISLVNKKPNERIKKHEIFVEYKSWFASLTEIKQLKEKKAFKDKTNTEQQAELDKLFYEKIFAREQVKMLYLFLVFQQKTIVIKVGEKQAEKDFIGYEFSNRRGHEGIKLYRDETGKPITKLYDNDNPLNPEKVNSYIYYSFLGKSFKIVNSLANNISIFDTLELMDFSKMAFEKSISLGIKKKIGIKSKYPIIKLNQVVDLISGGTPSRKENSYWYKGTIPWLTISDYKDFDVIENTNEKITKAGLKNSTAKIIPQGSVVVSIFATIARVGILGKEMTTNQAIVALTNYKDCIPKFIQYCIHFYKSQLLFDAHGTSQQNINSTILGNMRIPFPPMQIQENVIKEISSVEQRESKLKKRIEGLTSELNSFFSSLSHKVEKLGNLAEFKNGLNYSEKSNGDSVTIVGVKDFLEDFSPNLEKLVDVRIDGKLDDSYKLQEGDILVVRSNGSANLVGRFIYIDKLNKNTSYSGFTIRIRANSDKVNPKYLCYCLRTDAVRKTITTDPKGANIKSVNQKMLSAINVPLPDIKEQQKIMKKAEQLEKAIKKIETDLANIDNEKEQILKKYLE